MFFKRITISIYDEFCTKKFINLVAEWPEFMRPVVTPPPVPAPKSPVTVPTTAAKLLPLGAAACVTYNRVSWTLRVRKEVFTPSESLGPPSALHLMFCQVNYQI